jgi:TolB-like protein/Tfp pilus assembly protein PilF
MPRPNPSANRAIFLSYAREDLEAVRRIADALREAGLEVWFDQKELRGGDEWDAKIKRQIRECALFLPIVSAQTDARTEGYFRREWSMAVERTRDIASGVAFLLPVVIDDTREADAVVPEEFGRYHWTRLPAGKPAPDFIEHVRRALESPRRPPAPAREDVLSAPQRVTTAAKPGLARWVGAALALGVVAIGLVFLVRRPVEKKAPPAAATAAAASDKSIAVLFFDNIGADKSDESISDGLTVELITALQNIAGLRVQGRITSLAFKGRKETPQSLRTQLQVEHLLTGTVSRVGNQLRIQVDLVQAATGFLLWSQTYNHELSDPFAVRTEVTRRVADALKVQLGVQAAQNLARRQTESLSAYQLFLTGRFHWNEYSKDGFHKSIGFYEEAIKHDPKFARAYSGMADAQIQLAIDWQPPREQFRKAKINALQALKLDDKLAEAWVSLGTIQIFHDWAWPEAEASFKRALECNAAYPDTYHFYGHYLEVMGKADEAATMMRKGLERDPLSGVIAGELGGALYHARRYDEAIAQCEEAIKLEPLNALSYLYMAQAWNQKGQPQVAIATIERAFTAMSAAPEPHPELVAELAYSHARAGRRDEAKKLLVELRAKGAEFGYQDPFLPVGVHAALGDIEEALNWLEKACAEPSVLLFLINVEAELDPLRNHPRFHAVLRKMNLLK